MAMIYDVFSFDRNGNRDASFDSGVVTVIPRKGRYTQAVNTNWDRRSFWYDPEGNEINHDRLPWIVEQKREEAAEREAEARERDRENDRRWSALRAEDARSVMRRGVTVGLGGGLGLAAEGRTQDNRILVRITDETGRTINEPQWVPLPDYRQAIREWNDGSGNAIQTMIYRALADILPTA